MLNIDKAQLPADEATIRQSLAKYLAELEAHKETEGVPAPWPDYEILRIIAANGGDFIVNDDETKPLSPEEALRADLEQKRAAALRALEEKMLAEALADPDAPAEVKDYQAALATAALREPLTEL